MYILHLTSKIKQLIVHLSWAGMQELLLTIDKVRIFVVAIISWLSIWKGPHRYIFSLIFQDNPLIFEIFYFMVKFFTNKFAWNYLPKGQRPT